MRALLVSLFSSLTISGAAAPEAPPAAAAIPVCTQVTQIGTLPLNVEVDGIKVQFSEWMAKDVDAAELIGFRASATAPVRFIVHAGLETFEGQGDQWMNPHGVVGASVRGITSLEICH
jgi:hypothetical protein